MKPNLAGCFLRPAIIAGIMLFTISAGAQVATVKDSLGGAPVPHEIQDPEIIAKAKAEMEEELDGDTYHCPIPDGCKPRALGMKM